MHVLLGNFIHLDISRRTTLRVYTSAEEVEPEAGRMGLRLRVRIKTMPPAAPQRASGACRSLGSELRVEVYSFSGLGFRV